MTTHTNSEVQFQIEFCSSAVLHFGTAAELVKRTLGVCTYVVIIYMICVAYYSSHLA